MSGIRATLKPCKTEAAWLEERKKYLCSSEIATAVGANPYMDPYTLWCIKTGKVEPKSLGLRGHIGHALEPVIARQVEERKGVELRDPGDYTLVVSSDHPYLAATVDRLIVGDSGAAEGLVEMKTVHPSRGSEWEYGPELYAYLQTQHAMLVTGLDYGLVAALVGYGPGFFMHDVAPNDDFWAKIVEIAEKFMQLVNADVPPPIGGLTSRETIARMYPRSTEKTTVILDAERFDLATMDEKRAELGALKKQAKALEDEVAKVENEIKAAMRDNETLELVANDEVVRTFRWATIERKGYEVKPTSYRKFQEVKT